MSNVPLLWNRLLDYGQFHRFLELVEKRVLGALFGLPFHTASVC